MDDKVNDTITRAVTVSIYPIDGPKRAEIYDRLHRSFDACQRAANAAMRVWIAEDPAETEPGKNGRPRLLKPPKGIEKKAYHAARATAPELPSGCVADICQRVGARYYADRVAVRLSGRQSVPAFRRPMPLSVRTQDWSLSALADEHGREHIAARFALLDLMRDERPTLGLHAGNERTKRLLEKIIRGEYERRTIELLPAGWARRGAMRAKIVYRRPRPAELEADGVLTLRTGSPSLLSATTGDGGRPFAWNARSLRGKILGYEKWRREHAQDRKHERRTPASRRRAMNRETGDRATKHHHRVKTELEWIAQQVLGYAVRQGCGTIEYDDTDRSWVDPFPWHLLKSKIAGACEDRGIGFVAASAAGVTP